MEEVLHDAFMGIIIFLLLILFIVILFANGKQDVFIQLIQVFGDWFNDSRLML